jgi:hypothetical protein
MEPRPMIADDDGRMARARTLWSEFDADGDLTDAEQCAVAGVLSVRYLERLDYWRCSINGRSIEEATVKFDLGEANTGHGWTPPDS